MKNLFLLSLLAVSSFVIAQDPCAPACPPKPFPKIENCRCENIFVFGEFLYWRFSASNLAYGRTGVGLIHSPSVEVAVLQKGTTLLPDFDYDPGFRLGLGVKFGEKKAFDLVGIYTYMHSEPEGHIDGTPITNTFLPLNWFNSTATANDVFSHAGVDMDLTFQYAEVQSGYGFGINPHFALRPYFALTSYIVRGDLKVRYEFTTVAGLFEINQTHGKSTSWSVGPKVGIDFVTHITNHLGIFTNFNITQQIAHIDMRTKEFESIPSTGASILIQNGKLIQNRNVGLFGLEIGPTWDEWFSNYRYHLYIRATYGASTLTAGDNLSFLNNNNQDIGVNGEFRGLNVRVLFEF